MTNSTSRKSPTQAEVDMYIAQAHQMRADYIAKSVKAGFTKLRGLFANKTTTAKATA